MNHQELIGKSHTLLLAGDDDAWSVIGGIVNQEGEILVLDRGADEQPFLIQPDWLARIKPVPADLSDILIGADFFLLLSVGILPDDADPNDYIYTGLQLSE